MITVNLERELVKNKRKEISAEERSIVNKVDELNGINGIARLRKLGMFSDNVAMAHVIKEKQKNILGYDPDRVFTKEDVERLCVRYGLRCLPASLYNGEADAELPGKILEFEKKYGEIGTRYGYNGASLEAYICAPKSSFSLQKRPVDPLFFVKVREGIAENYVLLHKWGKDISAWRLVANLWKRSVLTLILTAFLLTQLATWAIVFNSQAFAADSPWAKAGESFGFGLVGLFVVFMISLMVADESGFRPNDHVWDSKFTD